MVDPFALGLYTQIAAGMVILGLGGILVTVTPRRSYTLSFGLFLGLWAGLILTGNLATLQLTRSGEAAALTWIFLHVAFLVVVHLPLAYFALTFPEDTPASLSPAWAGVLLAPSIVGAGLIYVDAGLFHQGFTGSGPTTLSNWGPAYPVYFELFTVAMYATIVCLHRYRKRTDVWIGRRRATYVLAAFLLLRLFEEPKNLAIFGSSIIEQGASVPVPSIVFAVFSLLGLLVGSWVALDLLTGEPPEMPGSRTLWWGAFGAALLFGALSGISRAVEAIPPVATLGLWRLAAVALLVHGILRFELFGVGSRTVRVLGWTGVVLLVVGVTLGLESVLDQVLDSPAVAFLAVQGLLVGGVLVLLRYRPDAAERALALLARRPRPGGSSHRPLEVYEAQLARLRGASPGGAPSAVPDLEATRAELDIDEAEHATLEEIVLNQGTPPDPGPLEPGAVLDGRYELGERLGEGARSIVHRATDLETGQPVAVKLLDAQGPERDRAARRFLWEARLARGLDHPNVVRVLDTGYADGRPYLVVRLAEKGSLEDLLEEKGPLDPEVAADVVDGVLAGLVHLHERGLVHGDLKPTNVLIDADGQARIADLGAARRWRADETQDLRGAGPGVGTPLYMSPEAIEGRPLTPRSDLYAVGAILYEAVTGEHYLGLRDVDAETVYRAVPIQPPHAPSRPVPDAVRDVWDRALAKDPSDRFVSAGAMRDALITAVESSPRAYHRAFGDGGEG